ncbi:hypothetical protein [Lentilactobacillus sp. SPB1-3]|uniref:Uncharacterized protein n=1 Tax=Lentilactobacillus terminaliae TaxID=3003483 RepID=A0ACD5DHU4_9LACO
MDSSAEKADVPDESWTNDQIKSYLDANNIAYKTTDTKAQLLAYLQ